jgi:hypothetical protein
MKVLQEHDFDEIIETITPSNIDLKLDFYATVLTVLMKLKEKFEKEEGSDAESLIDTDDIELCSDEEEDSDE